MDRTRARSRPTGGSSAPIFTGCLPTMCNARPGLPALPPARPILPTTPQWSARSMGLPPISKPISILICCSHWQNEDRSRNGEERHQDRIGGAIKRKRAANVGRAGIAAPVTHHGIVDVHAVVDTWAGALGLSLA